MAKGSTKKTQQNNNDAQARLNNIIRELYKFYHCDIDLSLERVKRFLHILGDPHLKIPPAIHVAGTNGKGSVIATLRSLLEHSGKTCHVITSPHLVHPTERIVLSGRQIDTQELADLLEECKKTNNAAPLTYFEFFTAAAFLAASREDADYTLLETGLGGRLDATNVIPSPAATIITTISMDHCEFLGNTIPAIAGEKAGIMKPGTLCIIGKQTDEAISEHIMYVFEKQAERLTPPPELLRFGKEWFVQQNCSKTMKFTFRDKEMVLPLPNLAGKHQMYNAAASLAAFFAIEGIPDTTKNISDALGHIKWQGRLQHITEGKLVKNLPKGWELWIDGGHNDSAGQALAVQAHKWQEEDTKKYGYKKDLHIILAMMRRKNPKFFISPLLPYAKSISTTNIAGEDSCHPPKELAAEIKKALVFTPFTPDIHDFPTFSDAINTIIDKKKSESGRILMTGSLYFIGNILSSNR